jgi:hypothetical protein
MMAEITDMYGASDDEAIAAADTKRPIVSQGAITEFEIDGTKIRSIDPGYVLQLERRLIQSEQTISEMRNELRQLGNSMRQRRTEMSVLQRQLDGKIDRQ